jgi:hypothetical protein
VIVSTLATTWVPGLLVMGIIVIVVVIAAAAKTMRRR